MCARHRGKRGALPGVGGAFDGNGNRPLAKDWLRSRGGNCQGKREDRTDSSQDCAREKNLARRRTRAGAGPDQNDGAGRNRGGVIGSWLPNSKGRSFRAARTSQSSAPATRTSRRLPFIATPWGCP